MIINAAPTSTLSDVRCETKVTQYQLENSHLQLSGRLTGGNDGHLSVAIDCHVIVPTDLDDPHVSFSTMTWSTLRELVQWKPELNMAIDLEEIRFTPTVKQTLDSETSPLKIDVDVRIDTVIDDCVYHEWDKGWKSLIDCIEPKVFTYKVNDEL